MKRGVARSLGHRTNQMAHWKVPMEIDFNFSIAIDIDSSERWFLCANMRAMCTVQECFGQYMPKFTTK